jgi:cell fate regulator YaaT (PSP1 superfamily)
MDIVYGIMLDNGSGYNARCDSSLGLHVGDFCVIRKDFYLDYGQIVKQFDAPPPESTPAAPVEEERESGGTVFSAKKNEIYAIQRKATVVDQGKAHENQMRAKSALRITGQYVDRLGLPMKLINAHYSYDGKLITVQFSAEGRVDFRELVKLLSQEFNTHIELRQIGVRDETAILGGIANCGRPLCCCMFLKDFASINVKMAKEQDLSLTPSTISGICGRLKCCLKYEHEGYLELEKTMPRRGELCECKDGRGRVVDRNLLTQKVTIQLENSTHTVICPASEVSVVYLDKYKMRGAGQGGSESGDAKPSAEENAPQYKPARQEGQGGQNRPHGQQQRKQGERPQRPAGEQRPQNQNQNRPQQNNNPNRPPRPPRQDGGNREGGKPNSNRPPRRPQQS